MYVKNYNRSETQCLHTHTHPPTTFPCKLRIKKAFSLAEMMVVMLILSLVIAASMPIITKQRHAGSSALTALSTAVANLTTTVSDLTTRLDTLESNVVECPNTMVQVANLCVANADASGLIEWYAANTLCSSLGLRLPSDGELNAMYTLRAAIGGFYGNAYWSATEYNTIHAWLQYFDSGLQDYLNKSTGRSVRCVRSL